MNTNLLIKTEIGFDSYDAVFHHLADEFIAQGIVKESYRTAIFEREADFPTGIALEHHAVAIPHCDAEHALQPAIYFIRPTHPVRFARPDEDGTVDAELIIALVVTDPKEQLTILRQLFTKLQDNDFIEQLLTVESNQLYQLVEQHLVFNH
ncbi:PTS galactitol transporter subunit IIA [[Haemophilus] felis]|nr:PTS galactitol transporter subunit IIA [[Haemophilus] felis]